MNATLRPYQEHRPKLGERVFVDPAATVIGKVELGDDVSVWPGAVLRGDINHIRIGARSNIQDGTVGHVTHHNPPYAEGAALIIGADVTVGHQAMLHGCTIGDRCLIGMGAILIDHAVIPDDVMIAAGSLVPGNKTLESGYLYVGSPVKRVRPLTRQERDFLPYSAAHYVQLKDRHLAMSSAHS